MAGNGERHERFSRLMEEYGVALRRLAGGYLRNPAAREDLFQDIALAIWTGLPGFRGESSERTWVYRVAHNTAATHAVKLQRRRENEGADGERAPEPAAASTPEIAIHEDRRRERFLAALRELPTLDFQIVTMHLDGLSYGEIASVTGLTQTNVGARLSRIRQTLTSQLGAEGSS